MGSVYVMMLFSLGEETWSKRRRIALFYLSDTRALTLFRCVLAIVYRKVVSNFD